MLHEFVRIRIVGSLSYTVKFGNKAKQNKKQTMENSKNIFSTLETNQVFQSSKSQGEI